MSKADVIMKFDAQTAAFVQRVQAATAALQQSQTQAEKTAEKVTGLAAKFMNFGKELKKLNFGEEMADQLNVPLTPADMLRTAVAGITKAIQFMNEEADRGADALKKLEKPAKSLIQISNNLGHFQSMRKEARDIARESGLAPEAAMDLMTSARNRGLEAHSRMFGQAAAFTTDAPGLVDAVADLHASFGEKAGDPRQVINKLLAGAGESKLNLENFSRESVKAAPLVSMMGGTSDELIASMAVGAGFFGKGEKAADRIARGAGTLNKMKLGGKGGLLASFDAFEKLSPAKQKKAMGESQEMAEFVQFMRQKGGDIRRILGDVAGAGGAAPGSDLFAQKIDIARSDPEMAALMQRNRAAIDREVLEGEKTGVGRLKTNALVDTIASQSLADDEGALRRSMRVGAAKTVEYLGGNETSIKAFSSAAGNAGYGAIPGVGPFIQLGNLISDLTRSSETNNEMMGEQNSLLKRAGTNTNLSRDVPGNK